MTLSDGVGGGVGALQGPLLHLLNDGVVTDDVGQSSQLHGVHKRLEIIEV